MACPQVLTERHGAALREIAQQLPPLAEDPAQEPRRGEHAMVSNPNLVDSRMVSFTVTSPYSRLGEAELAWKYAELCRTTKVPLQDGARD